MEVKDTNNSEYIYIIGLTICLLSGLLSEVLLKEPEFVRYSLKVVGMLVLGMRLIIIFHTYSSLLKLIILLSFSISLIVGVFSDQLFLLVLTFEAIFGAKDIDYRKILKIYFVVGGIFSVMIILLSSVGLIENRILYSFHLGLDEGGIYRHCFGYKWPTNFATHVFFVLLAYWMYIDGKISMSIGAIYTVIAVWIMKYADARLGSGCIILILLFSFCDVFFKKHVVIQSAFYKICIWWIPLMFILTIYTVSQYDSFNMVWVAINLILAGRLELGNFIWTTEAIPLFGQKYEMYGGDEAGNLYNYIDSSFLQYIIIYGIIYSACIAFAYWYIGKRAYRKQYYIILYALMLSGINGFIAQHFTQIYMNPALIAAIASFPSTKHN